MIAAAAIVIAAVFVIAIAGHPAEKDYISYWSAGRLLLHHSNPYSPAQVFALEKTQGYSPARPLIMRNPPWALFLAAPLGFPSPLPGLLLWTLAAAACVFVSARLLNIPPRDRAFAFLFAPALASICTGQSSPFLLLGFSLFLYLHSRRPFLAGASLLLMAIKPHLFLVFWAVLLIDCVYRRSFLILAGGISALAAATAFAISADPHIWQHYFAMLAQARLDHEFVPTLSILLRLLIDRKADWIQLIPSCLALVWGTWYYARHRSEWNWQTHGMLVILVAVLVSPYSWFPDEIVLLPALALVFTSAQKRKYSLQILVAINCLLILALLVAHIPLTTGIYFWTPLAWLTWYLYATKQFPRRRENSPIPLAGPAVIEKAQV
jgi:hypothetical protein